MELNCHKINSFFCEQRFFDTLHKMFNAEIVGIDIKDLGIYKEIRFTLTMQHLPLQIKRRDLTPEAQARKGLKLKETGNESIPKYECKFTD